MKVSLVWFAPTQPDPDTYVASVMRRTRDPQSLEGIVGSLETKGKYCLQCDKDIEISDKDHAIPEQHTIMPRWVVKLVRGAKLWKHFDVLEHVQYSFSIEEVSRVLTHQLVRHRLASYSQISARLVATRGYVVPPVDYIGNQALREELRKEMTKALSDQWALWDRLVKQGVRREDARYVVGDGQTTSLVMTLNARSLGHILKMRLDPEAQWEIRELAEKILGLVQPTAPVLWEQPIPEGL